MASTVVSPPVPPPLVVTPPYAVEHRPHQDVQLPPQRPSMPRMNSVPAAVSLAVQPTQTPIAPSSLPFYIPPNEQRIIEFVAPFASQHNLSEYARSKFGERGCPAPYLPLSIGAPLHVQELRKRQAANVAQRSFFPAPSGQPSADQAQPATDATVNIVELSPLDTESGNVNDTIDPRQIQARDFSVQQPLVGAAPPPLLRSRSEPTLNPPHSPLLQQALSSAIASDLPRPVSPHSVPSAVPVPLVVAPAPPQPKTSDSHPINISYLVPPEMIPYISAHLFRSYPQHLFDPRSSPVRPPAYEDDASMEPEETLAELGIVQFALPAHLRFDAFLNYYPPFPYHPQQQRPMPPAPRGMTAYQPMRPGAQPLGRPSAPPTSRTDGPIMNITSNQDIREAITDALQPLSRTPQQHDESAVRGRSRTPSFGFAGKAPTDVSDEPPLSALPYPLTASVPPPVITIPPALPAVPVLQTSAPQIGNVLLSSCPGKKVRLNGPVKGRGAICRSVPQDLARIRSLGVGLIINCLDDGELAFLGASWPDYSAAAAELGIDVLRIPTPEGLAPLETARLDTQLDWVIRNYTLKGINVLVHCRGGVGRAGLVASSWAIKMGLCGATGVGDLKWSTLAARGTLRRDTFEVVAKVVAVMRRRRSVKAIETYEQARFLVDFVEHLREAQEPPSPGHLQEDSVESLNTPNRGSPAPSSVGRESETNTEDTLVDVDMSPATVDTPPESDKTPLAGDFKIQVVDNDGAAPVAMVA